MITALLLPNQPLLRTTDTQGSLSRWLQFIPGATCIRSEACGSHFPWIFGSQEVIGSALSLLPNSSTLTTHEVMTVVLLASDLATGLAG